MLGSDSWHDDHAASCDVQPGGSGVGRCTCAVAEVERPREAVAREPRRWRHDGEWWTPADDYDDLLGEVEMLKEERDEARAKLYALALLVAQKASLVPGPTGHPYHTTDEHKVWALWGEWRAGGYDIDEARGALVAVMLAALAGGAVEQAAPASGEFAPRSHDESADDAGVAGA